MHFQIKPLAVHYGLGVPDHDKEGRLITCEFEKFYFIVSYVPNSGAKLERLVCFTLLNSSINYSTLQT